MQRLILSSQFDNTAIRREIASEDSKSAGRFKRFVYRQHHFLVFGFNGLTGFVADSLSCHREFIGVEQVGFCQTFREQWNSTGAIEIRGDKLSTRFQICQHGRSLADCVEVLKR